MFTPPIDHFIRYADRHCREISACKWLELIEPDKTGDETSIEQIFADEHLAEPRENLFELDHFGSSVVVVVSLAATWAIGGCRGRELSFETSGHGAIGRDQAVRRVMPERLERLRVGTEGVAE
jgi:hypothetical protein